VGGGRGGLGGRGLAEDLDRRELGRALSLVGELGLTVVVSIVILGLAGHYLDGRLGTGMTLTAVGTGLGLAAGLWRCYRRVTAFLE